MNSATQAKKELDGGQRVEVFDSLNVSMGLGLLVREVAKMGNDGASLDDALAFLNAEAANFEAFFTVDTLRYLVRGGRASKLQGFFGTMLDIKPIIAVRRGETHPVDRVRTRKRLYARFQKILAERQPIKALGFIHSRCRADAETLAADAATLFPAEQTLVSEFSPVMGVHLGPQALGVAIWSQG